MLVLLIEMRKVMYRSTNNESEPVSFKEALLRGQAPDKGLYMPTILPKISIDVINEMKNMSYPDIASTVMSEFIPEIPSGEFKRMIQETYDFDVPIERVYERKYIMRLDRGPTASFKDLAARMMANLIKYYIEGEDRRMVILTATSGDTGSAVAHAFSGLCNIDVVVLFPEREITELQRKQMTTLGNNVIAIAVDGKFDDCQDMVKQAFVDNELKYINLSSANSINIGRLLPQMIQYFYAHSRLSEHDEKIVFSVPCGNLGHLTAGVLAKSMGLPVHKFVVATNENDEFLKFLETGRYMPIRPSRICISNAMNVGHPSNLARLINLYGGWMDENGNIHRMPDLELMRKDMFSVSITDDETISAIRNVYEKYGIILEPHGAVAWAGLSRYLKKEEWNPCVSFETAHPAKFPEEIKRLIGIDPELPTSMVGLRDKKEQFEYIDANYKSFKRLLKDRF